MILKNKTVKLLHGLAIIIFCLILAGSFIYLSSKKLNNDVEMASQVIDVNDIYDIWNKNPQYEVKRINVSFQYDTRQVEDIRVINYKITNEKGEKNITQEEINVLLNCYRNNNCQKKDISEKTKNIIENYKHSIIKDDLVIVYGLFPIETEESFGEIESNVFVINENLFATIVNPIYSDTNKRYNTIRKKFLIDNSGISYEDYLNKKRQNKKEEMVKDAINEILEEKAIYVKNDIDLLEIIANSVYIIDEEK